MSKFRNYGPLPDNSFSDVLNLSCDNIELLLRYISGGTRSFNAVWSLYVDSCDRQELSKDVIKKSVSERIADHIIAHPSKYGEARRWKKTADYSRFVAAISKRLREVRRRWDLFSASVPLANYSIHFGSANEGRDRWIAIVTDSLPPGCGIRCSRGNSNEYLLCRQTLEEIKELRNRKKTEEKEGVLDNATTINSAEDTTTDSMVPSEGLWTADEYYKLLSLSDMLFGKRGLSSDDVVSQIILPESEWEDIISSAEGSEFWGQLIFSGPSSGKSTLARVVAKKLIDLGVPCYVFDGKFRRTAAHEASLMSLIRRLPEKSFLIFEDLHLMIDQIDRLVISLMRFRKMRFLALSRLGIQTFLEKNLSLREVEGLRVVTFNESVFQIALSMYEKSRGLCTYSRYMGLRDVFDRVFRKELSLFQIAIPKTKLFEMPDLANAFESILDMMKNIRGGRPNEGAETVVLLLVATMAKYELLFPIEFLRRRDLICIPCREVQIDSEVDWLLSRGEIFLTCAGRLGISRHPVVAKAIATNEEERIGKELLTWLKKPAKWLVSRDEDIENVEVRIVSLMVFSNLLEMKDLEEVEDVHKRNESDGGNLIESICRVMGDLLWEVDREKAITYYWRAMQEGGYYVNWDDGFKWKADKDVFYQDIENGEIVDREIRNILQSKDGPQLTESIKEVDASRSALSQFLLRNL